MQESVNKYHFLPDIGGISANKLIEGREGYENDESGDIQDYDKIRVFQHIDNQEVRRICTEISFSVSPFWVLGGVIIEGKGPL